MESDAPVPEGRHQLRFAFEATGNPAVQNGKGAPGRGPLYIDNKLVGQADILITMPITLALPAASSAGPTPARLSGTNTSHRSS